MPPLIDRAGFGHVLRSPAGAVSCPFFAWDKNTQPDLEMHRSGYEHASAHRIRFDPPLCLASKCNWFTAHLERARLLIKAPAKLTLERLAILKGSMQGVG